MDARPGTYVLILRNTRSRQVQIGRWGMLALKCGYYAYVGSAFGPGGVRARVSRHCRAGKATRWHVDYLREVTQVEEVWITHNPKHLEHDWASAASRLAEAQPIPRFGSSDCDCASHLYFFERKPDLEEFTKKMRIDVRTLSCDEIGANDER